MKKGWGIRAVFLAGLLLCGIPAVYGIIGQQRQRDAVATYQAKAKKNEKKMDALVEEAREYNDQLYQSEGALVGGTDILSDASYESMLDLSGTGAMGSLDIPKINVELPIYHGTGKEALSNGIGHMQGTSLPVGGENTHCVLTGHRGLPSAKLLVRLDEMEEGDLFFLRVGNDTLAYRVNDIRVVEPDDISALKIRAGKDLVSLVTCTPYGINTKRLVVTGERAKYTEAEYDAIRPAPPSLREIALTALPLAFSILAIVSLIRNRKEIDYENLKI